MTEKTLEQAFGVGATQTATTLTILKSRFENLIPTATNSADSLVVALLNLLAESYPNSDRQADKDVSIVVTLSPIPGVDGDFTVLPNVAYKVYNYTVQVFKKEPSTAPNPSDFDD